MEKSSFFNSIGGDRTYSATDWAAYFSTFIGNGVFPLPGNNLQAVAGNSGLAVTIMPGKAWINGYCYENTEELMFTLSPAHGVLNRIDRIVIRWDLQSRSIVAAVKSSEAAQFPTAPTLQRDADIYELCLADVLIGAGAIAITQSKINDKRLNGNLCGLVVGTVRELDTTVFDMQLQAWFSEYQHASDAEYNALVQFMEAFKMVAQTEFASWFDDIQAVLDENAVSHLYNMIAALATTEQAITETTIEIDNATAHDIIYTAKIAEDETPTRGLEIGDGASQNILTIGISQGGNMPLHRRIALWAETPNSGCNIRVSITDMVGRAILSGHLDCIDSMTEQADRSTMLNSGYYNIDVDWYPSLECWFIEIRQLTHEILQAPN